MSVTAKLNTTGQIVGLQDGSPQPISLPQINLPNAVGGLDFMLLAEGDNQVAIPTGTTVIIIIPPVDNVVVLKLKGNTADVGVTIQPNLPFPLPVDPAQALYINAASALSARTELRFL